MKDKTFKALRRFSRRGLQTAIVVALSFQAGFVLTQFVHADSALFASMWSMVSGILVLQDNWPETIKAGKLRVLGASIGASITGLYMYYLPIDVFGMAGCAAAATLVAILCRASDGGRGAAVTVVIVMIVGAVEQGRHPSIGAGLRFLESCFGTSCALLVSWGWIKLMCKLPYNKSRQRDLFEE